MKLRVYIYTVYIDILYLHVCNAYIVSINIHYKLCITFSFSVKKKKLKKINPSHSTKTKRKYTPR